MNHKQGENIKEALDVFGGANGGGREKDVAALITFGDFNHLLLKFLPGLGRLRDAGVPIVCGSDSAWGRYKMGGFQHEIEAEVEAGMSPMEAIVSATSDSARSCWVDNEAGTLEVGKQGDILLVDGDPSGDVKALWNVVDVFQNGGLVDRSAVA